MSFSYRLRPIALGIAVTLAGCSHHPVVAPAPLAAVPPPPDSTAMLAARQAREDSLRAARDSAARRAREDSLLLAQRRVAQLQDLKSTLTAPLYFDFDKAALRPASLAALDSKTPILENSPSLRILIAGNADERGSAEYNLALGMRRAAAAREFLALHGVDSTSMDVVSYGKERPVCTEHNEACWQQNRRDDFTIVSGQPRLPPSTT